MTKISKNSSMGNDRKSFGLVFIACSVIAILVLLSSVNNSNAQTLRSSGSGINEDVVKGGANKRELGAKDGNISEGRSISFEIANLKGGKTGTVVIKTHPEWAPIGVERFDELVDSGFWTDCRFFRVVSNFMDQFGINGDPKVQSKWRDNPIKDDKVLTTNARGTVTFATSGPNTRTTQLFINTSTKPDGNKFLDSQGFSPFGEVVSGMDIVDEIYSGYGESPKQGQIQMKGNSYLEKSFPELSYIVKAEPVESESLKI